MQPNSFFAPLLEIPECWRWQNFGLEKPNHNCGYHLYQHNTNLAIGYQAVIDNILNYLTRHPSVCLTLTSDYSEKLEDVVIFKRHSMNELETLILPMEPNLIRLIKAYIEDQIHPISEEMLNEWFIEAGLLGICRYKTMTNLTLRKLCRDDLTQVNLGYEFQIIDFIKSKLYKVNQKKMIDSASILYPVGNNDEQPKEH